MPLPFTRGLIALILLSAVALSLIRTSGDDKSPARPLYRAHAHNDYLHERPLFDALAHGFCSVEADIWLTPEGLLIGHERKDLQAGRTLENLYLDPLRERATANNGQIYPSGPPFYLLIDVKTEAAATYAALDKVLARYADILSVVRDGKLETKAVSIILSGNRATDVIEKQAVRYVSIDGRPEDLKANPPPVLFPWISANSSLLFKWQDDGSLSAADREKLGALVKQAHEQGRRVRLWSTPEKTMTWKELLAAGVDFINTDKLDELRNFLLATE
jgi:hypothetical protein